MWSNLFKIFTTDVIHSNALSMWIFLFYFKKLVKIGPKNRFCGLFWEVLLRPVNYTSIFYQIIRLMEVHNGGKFHRYSICGFQVIKFEMFLWQCSIHEIDFFKGFLGPFCPKYGSVCLKCWPEVLSDKTKTVFKQSFKIWYLSRKGTYSKLTVLVNVLVQVMLVKEILLRLN